jgi:hypothetical protein
MTTHFPRATRVACFAASWLVWMSAAGATQQCSIAMPATPHGYWSWRLIDGRKCWYQGKPGLSKALLEWRTQGGPAQSVSSKELASATTDKPSNPLDSEAWAPAGPDSFEALWRARVEQH